MTVEPYITATEDAEASGWVEVGGVWLSREPLRDRATGLYARFTYAGAVEACQRLGGRLLTADELDEAFAAADAGRGLCLSPVTLPDAHLAAEAGVVLDWEHNGSAVEAFLTANMGGRAWAEHHDARVDEQLAALGDNGLLLVNIGKLWVGGVKAGGRLYTPPQGRAWLYGWRQANGRMIQPRPTPNSQGPHGANAEHDYGTLTVSARDEAP